MRPELASIVEALLVSSADAREVALDAIGEAIGARTVSSIEIDAMIAALEQAGRKVVSPQGGAGEDRLKVVISAVRALTPELGRKPNVEEIATKAGLPAEHVRHALMLLRIMQR